MTPNVAELSAVGFSISVDTEEDDWEPATCENTTLNIREIPRLQRLFQRIGACPTFFVTYQVASDPTAAAIIPGSRCQRKRRGRSARASVEHAASRGTGGTVFYALPVPPGFSV